MTNSACPVCSCAWTTFWARDWRKHGKVQGEMPTGKGRTGNRTGRPRQGVPPEGGAGASTRE